MGPTNVINRKFSFCPRLSELDLNDLIVQCPICTRFAAACCQHESFGGDMHKPEQHICHFFQLVFTDGACSNNGQGYAAKAGLGIAIGADDDSSWSVAVDDTLDTGPRTNQRAELLAAIEGLKKLDVESCSDEEDEVNHSNSASGRHAIVNKKHRATYIVVTDSEYVVKGITEWFPEWRGRGWRRTDGKRPVNLDLFMKLDEYTTTLEQDRVAVGFWHVPRAYNRRADKLAKEATRV